MPEYIESICRSCFHSYVCEQFNEHRDSHNEKCHFYNDHFVPAADVVSKAAFEQVKWERDTAVEQLKEHGIPFGGKTDVVAVVRRCKDCKRSAWRESPFGVKTFTCELLCADIKQDDFAVTGERRDDNAN